jgi:hypothetical protein
MSKWPSTKAHRVLAANRLGRETVKLARLHLRIPQQRNYGPRMLSRIGKQTGLVPSTTNTQVNDDTLSVDLSDGRTISAPVAWYPRLSHGTSAERARWRLIGNGSGIHWPDLDEDISVDNLLAGRPSGESQTSFKRWLDQRAYS